MSRYVTARSPRNCRAARAGSGHDAGVRVRRLGPDDYELGAARFVCGACAKSPPAFGSTYGARSRSPTRCGSNGSSRTVTRTTSWRHRTERPRGSPTGVPDDTDADVGEPRSMWVDRASAEPVLPTSSIASVIAGWAESAGYRAHEPARDRGQRRAPSARTSATAFNGPDERFRVARRCHRVRDGAARCA